MEHIIKMKGTEERSLLQIREETFDVRIKRTKPKAECVNGSVRALFGKLGHACLSEEKLFPCKAALRPLSLSLPHSFLLYGVQAVLGFSLLSFPRFLSLPWGMLVMCCGHFCALKTGWSTALEIHWFSNSTKTLCPWGEKNALSWGLRKGTKCKSAGISFEVRPLYMCLNMSLVSI